MSALTYSTSIFTANDIIGVAPETFGPGDDLTVDYSVVLASSGGDITLSAGDDVIIHGSVLATSPYGRSITITAGAADVDIIGSLTLDGDLRASNIKLTALLGMVLGGEIAADILDLGADRIDQIFGMITVGRLQSTTAVSGDVRLIGTNDIAALGDFRVLSGAFTLLDNTATLTIDGAVSADDMSIVNRQAGGTIAHGASDIRAHTIELIADQMQLDAGTIAAADTIYLAPATSGTTVSLGGPAAATFALSQQELDTIAAPTLTIGKDASGAVTAGSILFGDVTIASSTLNLFAQGSVTRTNPLLLNGGNGTLNIMAGGTVDLHNGVDVGAVGGAISSGHFIFADGGTGAVIANAISTAGGDILLQQVSGADLSVAGAQSSHGGNILAFTNASIALNADVDAGAGQIGILSGATSQGAGRLVGSDLLAYAWSGAISLGSATNAICGRVMLSARGDISFTDTAGFMLGGLAGIHYASMNQDIVAPPGALHNSLADTAMLTIGGDVTQAGGANDYVLTGTLNLARLGDASPNVTLDNPFNQIHKLGKVDLDHGALTLADTVDLTIADAVTAGSVIIMAPTLTVTGGAITSFDAQTFHGAMTLGAATTLESKGGGVVLGGTLDLGSFDLHVNAAGASLFVDPISGSGRFFQEGGGTTTLRASNSYTGATLVVDGTLLVDGSITGLTAVVGSGTLARGGTLGGNGKVGEIWVVGTLAPGDSLGTLTTGDATLFEGAHLAIEIGGKSAGSYDQLAVHGSVDLRIPKLDATLTNGFAPTVGASFTIIDNDGKDAVNGTFLDLDEGATFDVDGTTFAISYHGGDGNDVTLTAVASQTAFHDGLFV